MKKIVIVDFDLKSAYLLKTILENNDYQVHVVNSIELANSILKKISPSLVIIDIMMEGNYEGLQLAKQLLRLDNTPYLFISEEIPNLELQKIQKTRPFGFLMKPLRPFELIASISFIINNYSYKELDIKRKKTFTPKDLDNRISKVIDYLEDNFLEYVDLNQLAEKIGCCSPHLIRIFKSKMKITPYQYVLKLKIDFVIELIKKNEEDLSIIAKKAGFNSYSGFYHFFKKHTGCSPEDYRKIQKYRDKNF